MQTTSITSLKLKNNIFLNVQQLLLFLENLWPKHNFCILTFGKNKNRLANWKHEILATWLCLEKSALAVQMCLRHNRSTTPQINRGPQWVIFRDLKKGLFKQSTKVLCDWVTARRLWAFSNPKNGSINLQSARCSSVPLDPQAVLRLPALSLSAVSVQAN